MKEQAGRDPLRADTLPELEALADRLAADAVAALASQGADPAAVTTAKSLHLRYAGTEAALIVPLRDLERFWPISPRPIAPGFGFATPDRPRRRRGRCAEATLPGTAAEEATLPPRQTGVPESVDHVPHLFTHGSELDAPVFERTALLAGDRIAGPALVREAQRHHRHRTRLDRRGDRARTT